MRPSTCEGGEVGDGAGVGGEACKHMIVLLDIACGHMILLLDIASKHMMGWDGMG